MYCSMVRAARAASAIGFVVCMMAEAQVPGAPPLQIRPGNTLTLEPDVTSLPKPGNSLRGPYVPGTTQDKPVVIHWGQPTSVTGPRPPRGWEDGIQLYIDDRPALTQMTLTFYLPTGVNGGGIFALGIAELQASNPGIAFSSVFADPSTLLNCVVAPGDGGGGPGINTCAPQTPPSFPASAGRAFYLGNFDWSTYLADEYIYSLVNLNAELYLDASNMPRASSIGGPGVYVDPSLGNDVLRTYLVSSYDPASGTFAGVTAISAIAEPASVTLIFLGLLALVPFVRRVRRPSHFVPHPA